MRSSTLNGPPYPGERGGEPTDRNVDDVALASIGTPAARQCSESSRVVRAELVAPWAARRTSRRRSCENLKQSWDQAPRPTWRRRQSSCGRSADSSLQSTADQLGLCCRLESGLQGRARNHRGSGTSLSGAHARQDLLGKIDHRLEEVRRLAPTLDCARARPVLTERFDRLGFRPLPSSHFSGSSGRPYVALASS